MRKVQLAYTPLESETILEPSTIAQVPRLTLPKFSPTRPFHDVHQHYRDAFRKLRPYTKTVEMVAVAMADNVIMNVVNAFWKEQSRRVSK
jgi:hypothetical protein